MPESDRVREQSNSRLPRKSKWGFRGNRCRPCDVYLRKTLRAFQAQQGIRNPFELLLAEVEFRCLFEVSEDLLFVGLLSTVLDPGLLVHGRGCSESHGGRRRRMLGQSLLEFRTKPILEGEGGA